jgi:hypothetical protein
MNEMAVVAVLHHRLRQRVAMHLKGAQAALGCCSDNAVAVRFGKTAFPSLLRQDF